MNRTPNSGSMDSPQGGDGGVHFARSSRPLGAAEQPFFRLDLMRSLHLHRRLAMGIALAGLILGAVSVALKWPMYVAESQVFIQPAAPQVMAQGGRTNWPNDTNSYDTVIQQQMQASSHPSVLLSALRKLGPGAYQRAGENEQAAAARLGKAIDAKRLGTSYQILITAQAKDPELAAKIANSMALALVENASEQEKAGDAGRLAVLTAEQARIQKELTDDRAEQEALNAKLGTASLGNAQANHYDEDIGNIREALVKAREARDEAAARLGTMEAVKGATPQALDAEADELAATDAGLVSMKMSLNQRRAVLIGQMSNLTPSHPQYKQDAAELAQIDSSLDAMMKDLRAKVAARIEQRLHTDLDRTTAVQDRLNGQLAQLAAAAAGATPQLQRASDLATNIARLQSRYAAVDEQVRNLTLEINAPGSAYLSAVASVPTHVAWGLVLKRALLLAFGGVFLGLLAALIANNLDQKIYIAADVTRVLGFPPMAQLPDFTEVSPGVAEDHLLRLTAAIDHAYRQGNLKNCIFTGVGAGAGVTTIATRVQSMLQTMGHDSVLVDSKGVLVKHVHSSGNGNGSSTALTTTERGGPPATLMQQLARETVCEDCLVLTDTAPLAISAETEYLARHVDAAIVVIEAGVTTRTQLRLAAETLRRLDVAAMGFVLNKVAMAKADAPFLHTVRAMEQHQGGQSRSVFRPMEPTRPLAAETRSAEVPREDRSLKQTPQQELASGETPAAVLMERLTANDSPSFEVRNTESSEDRNLKQTLKRELSAAETPVVAPTERNAAPALPVDRTEPGVALNLERSDFPEMSERPVAAPMRSENLPPKRNPSEELAPVQPKWTRLPERRSFEPKPVPPEAEANQAKPPLRIVEVPLTPRERQEMEAARLRAIAARARSQSQTVHVAPVPSSVRATPEPIQPVPAPASEQPGLTASIPEPTPLPVGRSIHDKAATPVQDQGLAHLEEWVNFGASVVSVPDAAPRAQRPVQAKPQEVADDRDLPLSSLRELSFAQAMRNLSRTAEQEPAAPFAAPVPQRNASSLADVVARRQEPVMPDMSTHPNTSHISVPLPPAARPSVTPARVTAQPEILPPKSNIEVQGKEPKANSKVDRRDRRETFDDVEVLPSWRGQYKKR